VRRAATTTVATTTPSRSKAPLRLIVGLGNPGPQYKNTRHNAGFFVLDMLAARHGVGWRKERQAEVGRWGEVTLLKPQTFMNLSGSAVQALATKLRLAPAEILVVHDDLDLPLGRLRLRVGGSAGGQRGVADTVKRLGPDFTRLKVGISRPPEGWKVENWVLSRFREDEKPLLEVVVTRAADAVEVLLQDGLEAAMGRFNGLDLRPRAVDPRPDS
jgi:peptidyl-tRNA hydrolase, PTH1 family